MIQPKLDRSGVKLPELLRELEAWYITEALRVSENITQAAKLLGMKRTTLVEKRKKLGLPLRFQWTKEYQSTG